MTAYNMTTIPVDVVVPSLEPALGIFPRPYQLFLSRDYAVHRYNKLVSKFNWGADC
jgi:hypothetical protein